ncbi:MAG: ribosome small subunit-dependent GTPase A [Deltaproteobacteria bacterium]
MGAQVIWGPHARRFVSVTDFSLDELGWSDFQADQLGPEDADVLCTRVAEVHRNRLLVFGAEGTLDLFMPPNLPTTDIAVGDWVLSLNGRVTRALEPKTLIKRRSGGADGTVQLIAANVDTLFIVTSHNADFNLRRLERYLALAYESEVTPVIILTKADMSDDIATYVDQARGLKSGLEVVTLNAKSPDVTAALARWCRLGQTVALTGSSGVGKTTLTNALTGGLAATAGIREDDARGRHTTTHRALSPLPQGGWIIDTPGIRELSMTDMDDGIDAVFADVAELSLHCKFNDCAHQGEPGCAIGAAIADGSLDRDRFERWTKLKAEGATAPAKRQKAGPGRGNAMRARARQRDKE